MKVIQSVLIACALSTAFAGTANAGSEFGQLAREQAREALRFIRNGGIREGNFRNGRIRKGQFRKGKFGKGSFREFGGGNRNRFSRQVREALGQIRRRNRH